MGQSKRHRFGCTGEGRRVAFQAIQGRERCTNVRARLRTPSCGTRLHASGGRRHHVRWGTAGRRRDGSTKGHYVLVLQSGSRNGHNRICPRGCGLNFSSRRRRQAATWTRERGTGSDTHRRSTETYSPSGRLYNTAQSFGDNQRRQANHQRCLPGRLAADVDAARVDAESLQADVTTPHE